MFLWIILIIVFLYFYLIHKIQESRRLTLEEVYDREDLQKKYGIFGNKSPKDYGFNYKEIKFFSRDDLLLKGWYIKGGDKFIIFNHGRSGNRLTTLEYLEIVKEYGLIKDYSILLYDMRNGGKSPESKTGIGDCFRNDVYGAIEFMKSQGHNSGVFWSFSMGVMGTLLALKKYKKPLKVDALIFDSPLSNSKKIIEYSFSAKGSKLGKLASLSYNIHLFGTLNNYCLHKLMKKDIKALIIHSKDDKVTPYEFFEEELKLMDVSNIKVKLFDTGPHLYLRGLYSKEYDKEIADFFKSIKK